MVFIDNKYSKCYFNIITQAKSRNITNRKEAKRLFGYVERHHIHPRSLGGTNDKVNLVFLTAREHYICHLLLPKMTEGKSKSRMWHALWNIINQSSNKHQRYKISSRSYESIKVENNKAMSVERLGKPNLGAKNKPKTEEHKKRLSIANSGENNPNFGKKRPEHSIRMSGATNPMFGVIGEDNPQYGIKRDVAVCKKIKENRWDEQRRREHAARVKERRKLDPLLTCTHCGKQGKGGVMYRFHFSKCKLKF
jgi:hypothetical protein